MPENFYFQGENTTFINRPQDTVIRDFQNAHGTAIRADDLTQLLRLVLTSRDMAAADREEAASTIHDIARIGSGSLLDPAAASTRLERLRALLSSSADIAQPALTLLASLTAAGRAVGVVPAGGSGGADPPAGWWPASVRRS
ncbi:hypothetical protein ACFV2X_54465 [Streptomyces sp. NPDC059679]|uniref:hypothetical protein n=1 Tax=Streptomyces sp. NPDC059679 TaxID=3346903 RepID=UPI0036A22030